MLPLMQVLLGSYLVILSRIRPVAFRLLDRQTMVLHP